MAVPAQLAAQLDGMDEPTIPERLRDLQADVSRILANLDRYVTQEQRTADKELIELKIATLAKEAERDQARLSTLKNLVWSAVVAPVIVGVILYLLIGKTP